MLRVLILEKDVCVWCGQALDPVAAETLDSAEDALFDHVIEADDEDLVEDLLAAHDYMQDFIDHETIPRTRTEE